MDSQPLRIVSIGAHPADVFDQSGGAMAHHAKRGDHVGAIALTHGARVHDAVISDAMQRRRQSMSETELMALMAERAEVKAEEVRDACRILGFDDVRFLGFDDAVLMVTPEIVKRLARLIREMRPDIVLTHSPDGPLNAHTIAGQTVVRAIEFAQSVDPEDNTPLHRVARVFYFWPAAGLCEVAVDISDVIDKKLAALDCLVSQGYNGAYARKRIETNDGAAGVAGGCAYAERFASPSAETHYFLPLPAAALARSRASDHQIMAGYSKRLEP